MKYKIAMSARELQRIQVLEQVSRGLLSLIAAPALMKVCYRHVKRLFARYRREGPEGLPNRHRGRAASGKVTFL